MDGWIHMVGMIAGIFFFCRNPPIHRSLVQCNSNGRNHSGIIVHLSHGTMVFLVVAVALLGFYGAEKLEAQFRSYQ